VLNSTTQERQLEPRYRRVLSFGDVLDESIGLFRRHWVVFALVSAVCLIPPGLLEVLITFGGALDTRGLATQFASGTIPDVNTLSRLVGVLGILSLVSALFALAWAAAVVVTADEYLHGTEPSLSTVIGKVIDRYPIVLVTSLVSFVLLLLVALAAAALMVVTIVLLPIFILGCIGAIVGVILWWTRPTMRTVWLKWLIILATPFGLFFYIGGTLALALVAAVLEPQGPISALRRSRELIYTHWFRAIAILFVAYMIVVVLQYIPTLLVQLPLTVLALLRGQPGMGPAEQAISLGAGIVTQVLCASMASICYTLLFIDLRNRRDATDIEERVSQLEANA
jgi:hypothetical protein